MARCPGRGTCRCPSRRAHSLFLASCSYGGRLKGVSRNGGRAARRVLAQASMFFWLKRDISSWDSSSAPCILISTRRQAWETGARYSSSSWLSTGNRSDPLGLRRVGVCGRQLVLVVGPGGRPATADRKASWASSPLRESKMFVAFSGRQPGWHSAMVLNASVRQSRENATQLSAPQKRMSGTCSKESGDKRACTLVETWTQPQTTELARSVARRAPKKRR
jgi:hypothetical protein